MIKLTWTFELPYWLFRILIRPVLWYRRVRYGYAFCRIRLTQGKYAIVDPDDYRRLSKYKWHASRRGGAFYAVCAGTIIGGKRRRLHMHRAVLNVPDEMLVDHINHNRSDNRKANLRPASLAQNNQNRTKYGHGTCSSKYKGVCWHRSMRSWEAQIRADGRSISLGYFHNEVRAARAYDRAAKRYHREFAALNFPKSKYSAPRVVLFLAGVFLEYLACFWTTPDRQSRCHAELTVKYHRPATEPPLTAPRPTHTVAAMAKELYIVDGHAHIYAAYFAPMSGQLSSPTGEPTKAVYIFTMALLGLIQRRKPDMLAVALDSKTKTFRSDIYREYKAQRPPMPEDMPGQIGRIEQILEAMKIPMLRVDGFEADDIIGTLARRAAADGYDCLICTKDKDVLQLLDEHVSAFDIKTDTKMDVKAMVEKIGVRPEQFIDVLSLQGDASDNVPGIPDVGPKTALEWIRKYGSLDNLYAHVDEIKGKRGDNLRRFKDKALLSKELVTIDCNVPLEVGYGDLALKRFDEARLADLFSELGFSRLMTQLGLSTDSPSAAGRPPLESQAASHEGPQRDTQDAAGDTKDYQLVDTPEKFETFLAGLKKQALFAVDTETTSINAMRAELVGMSFSWRPGRAFYLPVKAPLGSKHLDVEAVRPKLAPILADPNVRKIGQNIKYDMLVLRNAQMPIKGVHFDTMVASYCLDPERSHSMDQMAADYLDYQCIPISSLIGKGKNQLTFDMVDTAAACGYSAEDADVTFRLYLYLKERLEKEPQIRKLFEEVEMPLVPVLAEMEYNGVSLDTRVLRKMSGEITETLKTVTEQIYQQAGAVFNMDSPKQLGEVLFDRLGLTPVHVGKAGRSTDAAVLEQIADQHPVIERILQYRMLNKLKTTYVDKLGLLIHPRTGRVHASFNQTVTATGRLSSSNPNLQNIPIRTELGSKVRSAFVPGRKGDCILSADYSQIELRLLAHFSKDEAMRAAFAADHDIHRFVASQIFGVPEQDVTSEMRSRSKAVNFGIIYGQGAFGLSRSVGISQAEAKKFISDYFARYSSIREFLDLCISRARQTGYAETILHRRRRIQDLNSTNGNKRSQAERLAVNTVIQGSAADLIKLAMIAIQRKIEAEHLPLVLLLQVHDELVFELPTAEADAHAGWIREQMAGAIKLDVPLKVDTSIGPNWLSGK
jgi:DNA polymerase-1